MAVCGVVPVAYVVPFFAGWHGSALWRDYYCTQRSIVSVVSSDGRLRSVVIKNRRIAPSTFSSINSPADATNRNHHT